MRIWSIHPKYLDTKGLLALWRETLLAKNVLENKTKGYTNHPQLNRFKDTEDPVNCIHLYLKSIWEEATERDFKFDSSKFNNNAHKCKIKVSSGQINFEKTHLLNKLKVRDINKYQLLSQVKEAELHPLFTIYQGEIESWERI